MSKSFFFCRQMIGDSFTEAFVQKFLFRTFFWENGYRESFTSKT